MTINWKSVGAWALTTAGVVASAGAAGAYGQKAAPVFILIGSLWQAFSHPAVVTDPTSGK